MKLCVTDRSRLIPYENLKKGSTLLLTRVKATMESKQAALNFIKKYYEENKEPPSLALLCREVKGLSRRGFYEAFHGVGEACKLAGVPVPEARIAATRKALKERKKTSEDVDHRLGAGYDHGDTSSMVALSDEQVKRILGIAHLEGGKDPLAIVDELLERDAFLRENKGLTLDDTKAVFNYLEKAKEGKWTIPMLLSLHVRLWNAGVMSLAPEAIGDLASFLEKVRERGQRAEEILVFLSDPLIKDTLTQASAEEREGLKSLLGELRLKGLTVGGYMKEVAEFHRAISWHRAYKEGRVTWDQLKKAVKLQ